MLNASKMLILSISVLLAAASFADDIDTRHEHAAPETSSVMKSNTEWEFSRLWKLRYPARVAASLDDWPGSIAELDFQDTSVYGQVSKLRNLSLITLAEIGHKRLFLGVSADGLLGIHFGSFSSKNDRHYLELIRLPYLNPADTGHEVAQPQPDSTKEVPQQIALSW